MYDSDSYVIRFVVSTLPAEMLMKELMNDPRLGIISATPIHEPPTELVEAVFIGIKNEREALAILEREYIVAMSIRALLKKVSIEA